ncbi:MAG: protein kinase, partial [Acidobacteriota bacterium]|nr:protein kinase [Acidobacteriota bacterium]
MVLSAGSRLGPYEILAPLGAGGMGEVYRARDVRLGREVALKVLPEDVAGDPSRLARFEQEARSASALNHPNIVTIYDVGQEGAVSYIVMELVEGQSIRELLAAGPPPVRRALAIGTQIAEGLARAHAARLVHRDLKPENVMVTPGGLVKILDFGLAKLSPASADEPDRSTTRTLTKGTEPGVILGTAGYMSPEQATGRAVDFRSDQFSLGAILYELVTGLRAFQKGTAIETLSAIVKDDPPPVSAVSPQAPEGLRWVIERCLAKEPEERYASTRDLARDLANLRDRASESRATSTLTAPRPARRKVVLIPVAAGIIAIALAGVLLFRARRPAPPNGELSLAILPFQNLGGRSEDQYFADGMTESLITDLAKAKNLLVIARNSVFQYRGRAVDVRDVGRDLKVRYVLEGSVQRAGDSVRINAQLIDTATGYHLWAEKYDRPLADIFALQDDISRRIAESLQVALGPASRPGERPPTRSLEAYDAYLRAQSHSHRGLEAADVDRAIATFERAIALDPDFSRAHAELANAYVTRFFHFDP